MISVVIPSYNCAPYLRESLDSVLAQTHRNFEVIIADDGSTDATPAILASYGGRIRVVRAGHQGLSAARNLGLAQARGDWIAFHDADDVALPDRLAFHLEFLRSHSGCDAVFCNGERMESGGPVVPKALARRVAGRCLTVAHLFGGFPVYFQGALVPRAAFEAAGPFDPGLRIQPDIEYAYRLFARCRAVFADRVVFRYRWHTSNNSGDHLGGRVDIARILDRLERENPAAVRAIGRRRLRARLARHYYRIARAHLTRGDRAAGQVALARALALRPLHPRYRWLEMTVRSA